MIIKAHHHKVIYPFFGFYTRRLVKKHFHRVVLNGDWDDTKLAILLISNHISWWDGFWLYYLNQKVFKRKFCFMMLEEELRKHWYFQYTGGFSVKKGARSVAETMQHAAELLTNNQNLVLLFPQGEIQSLYTSNFTFEKGTEKLLKRLNEPVQILMAANLVDYFSNKKPSVYTYVGELSNKEYSTRELEIAYNEFYEQCVSKNQKIKTEQ